MSNVSRGIPRMHRIGSLKIHSALKRIKAIAFTSGLFSLGAVHHTPTTFSNLRREHL